MDGGLMSFNHRLVRHAIDDSFGIYEVYYDENGKITGRLETAIIVGNDLEDLKGELANITKALEKPELIMDEFGELENK
jgi:hypothetical protein